MIRVDPDTMIVITTRCTAECIPGFATVHTFPCYHISRINDICIFRIRFYFGKITSPSPVSSIGLNSYPALTGIITSVNTPFFSGIHGGIHSFRIRRCNTKTNSSQTLFSGWQTFGYFFPGGTAIHTFKQTAFFSIPCTVFPRPLPACPHICKNNIRIIWINRYLDGPGVFIDV